MMSGTCFSGGSSARARKPRRVTRTAGSSMRAWRAPPCSAAASIVSSKCARDFRVALMCAEKDPIDCHRTILIGRELVDRGADIMHILEDGRLEPHDETMQRLLARLGIAGPHLFFSPAELIEQAYAAQAARIADTWTRNSSVRHKETRPCD